MIARALLTLSLALALASPAAASSPPLIGIGEQKPEMFGDSRWLRLGMHDARYIAPWDVLHDERQLDRLDSWMAAARATGTRVLLGFDRSSRSARLRRSLPTDRRFAREFRRLRKRYPYVRDWITWNEANHPLQPTANRPRRVARFFGIMVRNCRGCRIVGADVLDISNMTSWILRFKAYASERPRIWGLHNYGDTNQLKTTGTQTLLRITGRGQVWFTEAGGLVVRREYAGATVKRVFRYSQRHAARSTKHVFRLACLSPRIRRVYLYHWQAPAKVTNWDSAFLGPRGGVRPAYRTLQRQLAGGWDRCR
jgi:polysaccharide biosynthesis protein PslG